MYFMYFTSFWGEFVNLYTPYPIAQMLIFREKLSSKSMQEYRRINLAAFVSTSLITELEVVMFSLESLALVVLLIIYQTLLIQPDSRMS